MKTRWERIKLRWEAIDSRLKARWSAIIFMVCTMLQWLSTVPNEYQDRFIHAAQDMIPVWMRPEFGAVLKFISVLAAGYAWMHAHSKPKPPDENI